MKTISTFILTLIAVTCYSQSSLKLKFDGYNLKYDIPIINNLNYRNNPLGVSDVDFNSKLQIGTGIILANITSRIEPYLYVDYFRKSADFKLSGNNFYSVIHGVSPELGTYIKLTGVDPERPTKGRFALNLSALYNIPFKTVIRKGDKKGDAIKDDSFNMFDGKGFQFAGGFGFDLRKSEQYNKSSRNSYSTATFKAHLHIGVDFVYDMSNYFNFKNTGIKGSASYLRFKLVMGMP